MYSKLDPIPYWEYIEGDEGMNNELEDTRENIKVRRQISDWCEYDSENRGFVSDSKVKPSKIASEAQTVTTKELCSNLSQSYYKNLLNKFKDEDRRDTRLSANTSNKLYESNGSPCSNFDNYIKSGQTIKTKKNSFIKVEEFRKSKQFRENKFPTNTSFSGVDKSQLQNLGMQDYDSLN